MKFIIRTFILLVLVNGFLLYMHYNDAGNATETSDIPLTYSQEIEVMHRSDGLYIRHHFNDLSTNRHEINWPETSVKRSCFSDESATCSRLTENLTAFTEGTDDKQSIMYVIPIDQMMEQSTFFDKVFATLDRSDVASTLFHLTDEVGIGGTWINGLELIGNKKTESIDYSLFKGSGKLSDIYWHKEVLPIVYTADKLTIYSLNTEVDVEQLNEANDALNYIKALHSTVIIDDETKHIGSGRIFVSKAAQVARIADVLLVTNINEHYSIPAEDQLTSEIVSSLLSELELESEKSRNIVNALTDNLTVNEQEQVIEILHNRTGEMVDATFLDDVIGDVTGFKTSFVRKNSNNDQEMYPFLLEDTRKVRIEGEEDTDVSLILKDGRTLYPVTKIMSGLGYNVSANNQSLYIEDAVRKFRFPLKEPFYVYNEQRYNVKSTPFEKIGDEFYFEESLFIRIFLVEINKTGETVDIMPIALFVGEEK